MESESESARKVSESERKVTQDGDGRERGDGDGGDRSKGKGVRQEPFVFGRTDSSGPSKASAAKEMAQDARRPISLSYKEKLLSPGGLGYLVTHAEEDDIVSGWRGYFARKNDELPTVIEDEEQEKQEELGGGSKSGYPVLSVTSEQYTSWCRPWMNSLVIKLLGHSVPKHVLFDRVRRMWRPRQPLKVVPLSNEYYIVSFSSMEDRDYALYEGPWMIDDHYLLVQRWRPNFNPKRADCQRRIAVWVRIPDLPMEFCTVEALGIIGNMIGKMIKIDRSTSIYDKGEFARICVEVDLQQPLLPAFTAFGEDKQLVYEGLHLVCFRCGVYGHERGDCPQRKVAGDPVKSVHLTQEKGVGVGERMGVSSQTLVDGVDNRVVQEQSVGAGVEVSSGHQKVRLVVGGMEEGSNMAAGEGDGGIPRKEQVTAGLEKSTLNARVNEIPNLAQDEIGGSKHLGPQMILRRDLRRNNQLPLKTSGIKSGSPSISQGMKKDGMNRGITRKGSNGLQKNEVAGADLMGSPNLPLKEKERNKGEWVVVGSKRKKDEKAKKYGKGNMTVGRPKMKLKEAESSSMVMTNGFAILHDMGLKDGLAQGDTQMDDGQVSELVNNSTACNMGDGEAGTQEQIEANGKLINGVGSGLAPPTTSPRS